MIIGVLELTSDWGKLGVTVVIGLAAIELLRAILVPLTKKLLPSLQDREYALAPPRWMVERDRDKVLRDMVDIQRRIAIAQDTIAETQKQFVISQQLTVQLLQELIKRPCPLGVPSEDDVTRRRSR